MHAFFSGASVRRQSKAYACPLCLQPMTGEKSKPAMQDIDRYRCPTCGTVIEFGSTLAVATPNSSR
jgi:transposase-like protein